MKRLIISFNTYEWAKYCSGMIIKEPRNDYSILIVCRDDRRPILDNTILCRDAIYAQRRYDLFNIGRYLGVTKLYNLGYEPDIINLHKLIAQIQLNIVVGQVTEIYHSNHILLNRIFNEFPKTVDIYTYGDIEGEADKEYKLSIREYDKKKQISDLMIGVNNKREKLYFSYTEKFYKVN